MISFVSWHSINYTMLCHRHSIRYILCQVALDSLYALSDGTRFVICFVRGHSIRYVLCQLVFDSLYMLCREHSIRYMLCQVALDSLYALLGGTRVVIVVVTCTVIISLY